MNTRQDRGKQRLLNDIGVVGFVLVEMNLYLDTHPYDKNAIDYFHYYSRIMKQKQAEYTISYGPLTVDSFEPECKEWKWVSAPMPWEPSFWEGGC